MVIGAGLAGLTAARMLSDRYDQVTVLDRDSLPDEPVPRRGVPQGSHPHILLASGLQELDTRFPGFEAELIAAGGTKFDTGTGLCSYRLGRRWPKAPTGVELVAATRPLIEGLVRDRVTKLPGVTFRDQVAVSGLTGSSAGVTGVVLDAGETVGADLVVDCTGRGARSDRWLTALGLRAPAQLEVKVGVAYATRLYRRRPGDLPDWEAVFTLPTSPHERVDGLAIPVEGDRWMIGIGGWHFPEVPTDVEAFERFARELPDPMLSELIGRAEPLTDIVVAKFPSSRRRLFEQLENPPPGYVALGDAICSFNPIYGQGMTCAAFSARALGEALDKHPSGTAMARDYYAAVAQIVETPWQFAVGGDFAYPQTTGPRPRDIKLRNWYSRQIAYASQIDAGVNRAFVRVQQLLDPPSVLMKPEFVLRVLRRARERKRQG